MDILLRKNLHGKAICILISSLQPTTLINTIQETFRSNFIILTTFVFSFLIRSRSDNHVAFSFVYPLPPMEEKQLQDQSTIEKLHRLFICCNLLLYGRGTISLKLGFMVAQVCRDLLATLNYSRQTRLSLDSLKSKSNRNQNHQKKTRSTLHFLNTHMFIFGNRINHLQLLGYNSNRHSNEEKELRFTSPKPQRFSRISMTNFLTPDENQNQNQGSLRRISRGRPMRVLERERGRAREQVRQVLEREGERESERALLGIPI